MFDLLVARQQFSQVERRADLADTLARRARSRDVVQQVIEQIIDRMLIESLDAIVDDAFDLAVGLAQQAFQCDRSIEAAVVQRLEHAANDPEELVHVVACCCLLEISRHGRQRFQVPLIIATLDPAEQGKLEFRPQPGRDCDRVLARTLALLGLLARLRGGQVEEQQCALGQKRFTARSTQVVEHGQQDERDIPAATQQALDVRRQLHHGTSQRIEAVLPALTFAQPRQVFTAELHFLGQERGTVGLGQLQRAACLV